MAADNIEMQINGEIFHICIFSWDAKIMTYVLQTNE